MIKLTFIYLVFKCFFYKFFLSKIAFNTVTNYTLLEKTGYTNLKYNYSKYPPPLKYVLYCKLRVINLAPRGKYAKHVSRGGSIYNNICQVYVYFLMFMDKLLLYMFYDIV